MLYPNLGLVDKLDLNGPCLLDMFKGKHYVNIEPSLWQPTGIYLRLLRIQVVFLGIKQLSSERSRNVKR